MAYRSSDALKKWREGPSSANCSGGWLSRPIRAYLIKEAGGVCSLCGWAKVHPVTNKVPLEIDHIDGDSSNNQESNLRVLCPNCHSLTPTFRALNKKSSRVGRVTK
jgi:hypothetical protein